MSTLYVRTTTDDYQSYTNFLPIDLTVQKNGIYQGGHAESIAWDFVHVDNEALRIHSIEVEVERGM